MNYKILMVDDDRELLKMLNQYFTLKNYTVMIAENGIEAMEKISANPDIILLDVNMPGMDGIEVCRRIRDMVSCPIIFLTAKVEEQDRVMGLLSGGDDYVLKPFSLKELDARIIAHLKREERLHRKKEQRFYGELVIDYASKCAHIKGNALELTKLEYEIIEFLSMNPEMVFDKERIYEKISGYSTEYVELTTAQKKQYRDIKNGIVADMENILASVNPLNCTLRLRQLTSGNPNLTDDSPKLDRIKEMLEEEIIPNGHKAIIFSQWSTIAKDLGIELSEYDPIVITGEVPPEQRQRLVDNFQTNPHCKVAIGTIGAMGTGLTLNKASYVFFMDKAWNSGDNAQAEDRAHRIGTVGAVNVISMVAKGTIDEAVEDYLLENKDLIDRVVDGKGSKQDIKTILNKLLSI